MYFRITKQLHGLVTVTLCLPVQAQTGGQVYLKLIRNLGARGGGGQHQGKDPVHIVQENGWARGPAWEGTEALTPHRDSIPGSSSP